MAIGHRADSSADLSAPGATTTITLPSGVQSSDIVIAVFGSTRNATTSPNVVGAPSGWTAIGSAISGNDGTNEVSLYAFWALGNVSSLGFSNSQTSGLNQGWVCSAFTGVDTSTPIDATGTAAEGNPGFSTSSVTIVTANAWEVIAACDLNKHPLTTSGFTAASNGASPSHASADVLYNTTPKSTGATGTLIVGIGVSDPSDVICTLPFALRPVSVPHYRSQVIMF